MKIKEKYLYKKNSTSADFNVWMAFPGNYSFSLSSLGYLWMYKSIDQSGLANVERICADTQKPKFRNVDLIGFSFNFDMDFLNIFKMLDNYKIPLRAARRGAQDPLIFAGGPVVSANPAPYSSFFDFFIIGDGEGVNERLIEICRRKCSRQDTLRALSELDGVYVPEFSGLVKKLTGSLEECIYTSILSESAFFPNTFIIEMSRGCANRCGFCLASYINLPLRCTPYNKLLKTIDFGLSHTNKIALLGAQISAHPHFQDVCRYIGDKISAGEKIEMSISSLRVDAVTPEVVKTLAAAGQKSSTLAVEAGSERLRKVINKNLKEEQILEAVRICAENGLKGLKFYVMLGLPTETQEDIEAIITLAKKVKNKGCNISFGFSTFVPKPHTPFQWCARERTASLEMKINYLKKELHKLGVSAAFSSPKWDYWQAVLSLGSADLGDFAEEVYRHGGKLGAFSSAAKNFAVRLPELTPETPLAWDFIQMPPGKEFLAKEYKKLTMDSHPLSSSHQIE